MIRGTKLFSHHARRLHLRSSARPILIAPVSTQASNAETWSTTGGGLAIGAASLSALGLAAGLAANNNNYTDYHKSVAKCEASSSPLTMAEVKEEGEEEEEEEGNTRFRTIPASEVDMEDDSGKSERAFISALKNGLFDTYDDGAEDWEEETDKKANDNTDDSSLPNEDDVGDVIPTNNAVTEHFMSFSPVTTPIVNIKPRMSHRHTNRRTSEEDEYDDDDGTESSELLATSKDVGSVDASASTEAEGVILDRMNTVRRNGLGKDQVYTKKMYFYQSSQVKDAKKKFRLRLFALPSSEKMGKEMAYLLGTSLNCIDVGSFTDGETSVKIDDMVRGKEIYVVCTTTSSSSIMELLLTVSALRRGSAKRICAVIPYYGYSRQDRRTMQRREPIAAADMARLLEEMGVDSVICVDLHNPLLKGFFSPTVPVDHLSPGPVAAAYFYEELYDIGDDDDSKEEPKEAPKITIVAAHENQVFRANGFRNALQKLSGNEDIRVALVSDTKSLWRTQSPNASMPSVHDKSHSTTLVGDVQGRKCIIIDDIINTGGTLTNAIKMVDKSGASEIYAWATHGVLHLPGNDAPEKIQEMDCLKYLLISNSVAIERELPPKIRKLSIAPLLAESVAKHLHSESIRSMMSVQTPKSEK